MSTRSERQRAPLQTKANAVSALATQVLVLAKAPTPGWVKTRLCPPCTHVQAARVASAALGDTLDTVDATDCVARRVLVVDGAPESTLDGPLWPRIGWDVVAQRGDGLGERIAHAFTDTAADGLASVLIGMDTPQLTGPLLVRCGGLLAGADAVLGHAADGGWWLLGLRDPYRASALATIPTSRPDTGERTHAALVASGLAVATAPLLRDVDTAADAWAVAARCQPGGRFATAVSRHVPLPVGRVGRREHRGSFRAS